MNKLLDYIKNGQGLGLRFLLILSVIVTLISSVFIRFGGADLIPYGQQIADQMLPIKIENGRVVEPHNTYKTAYITMKNGAEIPVPLVIDTRTDTLNTERLEEGIYLTSTSFYSVGSDFIKQRRLEGNLELPRADYRETFKTFLNWFTVIFIFLGFAFLFLFYFILALIYSLFAKLIAAVASRSLDFDGRMRLSSLILSFVYVVFYLLSWLGESGSTLLFFIVVLALQTWGISKLPKVEKTKNNNELPADK